MTRMLLEQAASTCQSLHGSRVSILNLSQLQLLTCSKGDVPEEQLHYRVTGVFMRQNLKVC
jgi:hypothetical protein